MQKKNFLFLMTLLVFDLAYSAAPLAPPPSPQVGPVAPPPTAAQEDFFGPPTKAGGASSVEQRLETIENVFGDICKNFTKTGGESLGTTTPPPPGEAPQPSTPGAPPPGA